MSKYLESLTKFISVPHPESKDCGLRPSRHIKLIIRYMACHHDCGKCPLKIRSNNSSDAVKLIEETV